jgi:hypothetical protein
MAPKRRALTPRELEEQAARESGSEQGPVRRILSKLRIAKPAGTQRTTRQAIDKVAPTKPVEVTDRSAENKAAFSEIRRLESAGQIEEAEALARERGWDKDADALVERSRRRSTPLRAAPMPTKPKAQQPKAKPAAPPVAKAPRVSPRAKPASRPAPALNDDQQRALDALASVLDERAAPAPAPARKLPKRVIHTPDEVRQRYSLPPAAKGD